MTTLDREPMKRPKFGWKVFRYGFDSDGFDSNSNSIYPEYCGVDDVVRQNVWLTAKTNPIISGDVNYKSGFHCFLTREEAWKWKGGGNFCIRKVQLGGRVRASGTQNNLRVIVVGKMKVIRPGKRSN